MHLQFCPDSIDQDLSRVTSFGPLDDSFEVMRLGQHPIPVFDAQIPAAMVQTTSLGASNPQFHQEPVIPALALFPVVEEPNQTDNQIDQKACSDNTDAYVDDRRRY